MYNLTCYSSFIFELINVCKTTGKYGTCSDLRSINAHAKACCARSRAWWCSWCLTKLASWNRSPIKLDLCNAMVTTELLQAGAVGHSLQLKYAGKI